LFAVRLSGLLFSNPVAAARPGTKTSIRGGPMSKLNEAEILARLPAAKGWERHGDMLVRTWQFPSFRRAIEFVNLVASPIEKTDHYPDLIVSYRSVRIEMSTHDVGGLTERDFALIAEINEIPTDR
jgi:4a-hydroxytetrahydrobiopterin dehydratase